MPGGRSFDESLSRRSDVSWRPVSTASSKALDPGDPQFVNMYELSDKELDGAGHQAVAADFVGGRHGL